MKKTRSIVIQKPRALPGLPVKAAGPRASLDLMVRLWLECFAASKNTRDTYSSLLSNFVRTTGADLLELTPVWFDEWTKSELARGRNVSTVRSYLTCLSSFYSFVEARAPGFRNPVRGVRVKIPDTDGQRIINIRKRALPLGAMRDLMDRFREEEERLGREPQEFFLWRMLTNTGCRVSEILGLEIYHPAKDQGHYVNYVRLDGQEGYVLLVGKGGKVRDFSLSKELTAYLKTHDLQPGRPIFLNPKTGKPLNRHQAFYLVKKIFIRFFKGSAVTRLSPHDGRHSYICAQIGQCSELLSIAKTVGNSRATIEKFYATVPRQINEGFHVL
jgi:integrase